MDGMRTNWLWIELGCGYQRLRTYGLCRKDNCLRYYRVMLNTTLHPAPFCYSIVLLTCTLLLRPRAERQTFTSKSYLISEFGVRCRIAHLSSATRVHHIQVLFDVFAKRPSRKSISATPPDGTRQGRTDMLAFCGHGYPLGSITHKHAPPERKGS